MVTHTHEISREDKTHFNLGNAHPSLGDFKTAMHYYERHLKIGKELGDKFGIIKGKAYGSLGHAYHSLGYFKTAKDYFERHLKIAKELSDRSEEGEAYDNPSQSGRR